MTDMIEGKILPPAVDRDPADPPIFLLQASSLYAPWLPDGVYQRVPIGSTGQVLQVQADGTVAWANSSSGFSNPMTTAGDMIDATTGGTPVRLAIGSNGQVLTVAGGLPGWAAAVGFANPMTTANDMILGGASGNPIRLPVGTTGQVLTIAAGTPSWQNSAAGFSNPMTTTGDIITSSPGATPARLAVGSSGQVLTVVGGLPAWQNASTGFANPMTSAGDMITGLLTGTATRLPIGANGQVLTVVSGAPQWAPGVAGPSAVVFPSGISTGVPDQAAITATWTSGLLANGGELILAPGKFYVKPTSGLICLQPPAQTTTGTAGGNPVCIRGCGPATIVYPVGAGVTGIYYHRSSGYGAQFNQAAQPTVGYLRDFVVDGTNTSGSAVGVDCGDGWGGEVRLRVVNFDTTGAVGLNIINQVFWTEKWRFWVELMNNTTAAYLSTNVATSDHSHEYNYIDADIFCNQNQNGIVVDGVNMGGSQLFLRGNMCQTTATSGAPTNNVAALTIQNTTGHNNGESRWFFGEIWMKIEFNQTAQFPSGSVAPYGIFMDGVARGIQQCTGFISHSLTDSNINNAEFSFGGPIGGDTNLAQAFPGAPLSQSTVTPGSQPAVPGNGVIQQNYGPAAVACVSGGTVTGVSINGTATGLISGPFYVGPGGSITLNYSAAPTWVWVPAAQMSS